MFLYLSPSNETFTCLKQSHRFGVFIVNFEHISHILLLFLLLNLNR